MKIKIKKLDEKAIVPFYAKQSDAGLDLTATNVEVKQDKIIYGTGIAMEIPAGHVGLVFPRSSIHKTDQFLTNSVGVIDSGYRGEIKVVFKNVSNSLTPMVYDIGDRVAQMIIIPYPSIEFEEVEELEESDRGEGGFGSTGQ